MQLFPNTQPAPQAEPLTGHARHQLQMRQQREDKARRQAAHLRRKNFRVMIPILL